MNFTSEHSFTVTLEPGEEVLGYITFALDDAQQPAGYRFAPQNGLPGPLFPTIAEALRARFGDVHLRIESIVS